MFRVILGCCCSSNRNKRASGVGLTNSTDDNADLSSSGKSKSSNLIDANVGQFTGLGGLPKIEETPRDAVDRSTANSPVPLNQQHDNNANSRTSVDLAAAAVQNTNNTNDQDNGMTYKLARYASSDEILTDGIESTSISIASQLSDESQQNLTNVLHTSNSPYPTFGLAKAEDSEQAGSSPTSAGAALTASQDSTTTKESSSVWTRVASMGRFKSAKTDGEVQASDVPGSPVSIDASSAGSEKKSKKRLSKTVLRKVGLMRKSKKKKDDVEDSVEA